MKEKSSEILVLPSWYPSKLDPLNGDFIQRHVKAISIYKKQTIIFVVKDTCGKITRDIKMEETHFSNYRERVIYYYSAVTGNNFIDKLLSHQKYQRIYKKEIKQYIAEKGRPEVIHAHVALKAGILALWASRRWNIPFVLSEHWSGYFDTASYRISDLPKTYQYILKKIFKSASKVTVVSTHLGKAIKAKKLVESYDKISNVVDTQIFFPGDKPQLPPITFIHASTMNYPKNMEGMFAAFEILVASNANFRVNLFGPPNDKLKIDISEKGLDDYVFFKGEVPQPELATAMRASDALILYSRFETFGCVIIEANAAGIPAIVSDIPVFHELIKENVNGIFAKEDDPQALADQLLKFIAGEIKWDKAAIVGSIEKYNFTDIGKQFNLLYDAIKDQGQ